MAVKVTVKAIRPVPSLNPQAIISALNIGAESFSRGKIKPDFESTWKKAPPVKVENKGSRSEVKWLSVILNEIYYYNSEGTAIRWALMSNDWRSQTKPGRIPARSGRGRVVIAGRRAMTARGMAPRPGIKGRHWDEQIVKKEQKPYERAMLKAITQGATQVWT